MSSDITLSSGISQNLYSLQSTQKLMEQTEYRLATGKKINSALDDPINFFAAQDHTQQASDLQVRKDSMGEAIQTIEAADNAIEAISDLIASAKSLAQSALSGETEEEVTEYITQFNELMTQIDNLAGDATYAGVNLLGGTTESLEVFFDEEGDSGITITGFDASSGGLGLATVTDAGDAASWWDGTGALNKTNINASLDELEAATSTLRSKSKTLSNQLSIITAREDFTAKMINTLEVGAANLVNADTNEESANLLTLQTQQELAINSLSIASSAQQAVLNLF
jgi:flagellin